VNRRVLLILGFVVLGLGILGIFLPLLPATPLLLLSAYLFSKSSDKYYRWLTEHRVFGKYISNFLKYKTIPVKVKVLSISMLWLAMGVSAYFVPYFAVRILMLLIAVGVSIHILSYKSSVKAT
jgi:uncharacterized membrane protein YbaN (DUF454 family)